MRNVSKQILTGLGIALLLGTTSVQAMGPNKDDKPAGSSATPVKAKVDPKPAANGAAGGHAPAAAAAPAEPHPPFHVYRPLNIQGLSMGSIVPIMQAGAKLEANANEGTWTVTTNRTQNTVDVVDGPRWNLQALLPLAEYAHSQLLIVAADIEWVSGDKDVYYGLARADTETWKIGTNGEFCRQFSINPKTEIQAGRRVTKVRYVITPAKGNAYFVVGNQAADTVAKFVVRNLRVSAPVDISNYLAPFMQNALVLKAAKERLIAESDGDVDMTTIQIAAALAEKRELEHIASLPKERQSHRAIVKDKDEQKDKGKGKEKDGKDKTAKDSPPHRPAAAPKAAAPGALTPNKPAATPTAAAASRPATPPNGAPPGAMAKKPAAPATAVQPAAGAAKK
jgi:hypothetical protein